MIIMRDLKCLGGKKNCGTASLKNKNKNKKTKNTNKSMLLHTVHVRARPPKIFKKYATKCKLLKTQTQ